MAAIEAVETTDDPAVALQIEQELLASLSSINRQTANHHQTFYIKNRDGRLVAGLSCSTAYGWLHVETLWVAEAQRARGLGRKLMDAAETFGREQGCHSAWLDTSNAGANTFYRRLGYAVFGDLANGARKFPPEHHRWFLLRIL